MSDQDTQQDTDTTGTAIEDRSAKKKSTFGTPRTCFDEMDLQYNDGRIR
jgi:hypothetical protein